jgi:hypothetical protein
VRDLDLTGLRARWHPVFRRNAPDHLPRHLLYRMIAYRLQAERLGDLDRDTAHFLDRVARDGNKLGGPQLPPPSRPPARGAARFGALLHHRSGRIAAGAAAAIFLEAEVCRRLHRHRCRSSDHQGNRHEQRNCHDEQKAARVRLG